MSNAKVVAETIRILGGEEGKKITALHYGPYDNGYVLVGLNNGKLLVFDPVTLDRENEFNVFVTSEN